MELKKNIAGYLLINKPKDISSFACIKKLQKLISRKYGIGHTGTLDPFATGLLIISIDRTANKHNGQFIKLDKIYNATGKLGELTDTLDHTGHLLEQSNPHAIAQEDMVNVIQQFGQGYTQVPPMFAALKHEGTPLYKLARTQEISREMLATIAQGKQRTIALHCLELTQWQPPYFGIRAHVSHGTYIRSLINDLAVRAGSYATTYELERTQIGPFSLDNAIDFDALKTPEDVQKNIISVVDMLAQLAAYQQPHNLL